jgi:uncharacterized membrane protein YdbT with pleckstrin-like domain
MVFMRPQNLDPKIKWVWLLPTFLFILLVWVIVSTTAFVAVNEEHIIGFPKLIFSLLFLVALLVFLAAPVALFYHLEYVSFTYLCAENEFVIRQGVITRHTTVIPYHRIQNINTTRTLIERLFGLATLEIETAGSNPEGELPGVSQKDKLIRQIMTSVQNSKRVKRNGSEIMANEKELLAEILKELSRTNHNLSQILSSGQMSENKRTANENKINWKSIAPSDSKVIKDKRKD